MDGAIDTEKSPGLETSLHNSLSVGSECLEPHHQMLHTSLVVCKGVLFTYHVMLSKDFGQAK